MSEVSAIAISVAKPGYEEKLAEALDGLLAPTHKERGMLQYEMYRDVNEPRCFVFIERWQDSETFDAHCKSPTSKPTFKRPTDGSKATGFTS